MQTRYRGSMRQVIFTGWLRTPLQSLKDRTILVMDDVMDGGQTLGAIMDYCRQMGARAVYFCGNGEQVARAGSWCHF